MQLSLNVSAFLHNLTHDYGDVVRGLCMQVLKMVAAHACARSSHYDAEILRAADPELTDPLQAKSRSRKQRGKLQRTSQ